MNDEILTIPELKILISQEEEQIKVKRQSLKYHEDLLWHLNRRLGAIVVDGLRLATRGFIQSKEGHLYLKRLKGNSKPYLECDYLGFSHRQHELTEEEAFLLASRDGRQTYGIDCSIWDTYRYPGEID